MIRAFYNFQQDHPAALINHAGHSLNSDRVISGNINAVRNDPAICIDPYARLKQGIVPDKGCYSYLRSASCYVSEGLLSPVFPYGNTKKDKLSKLSRDIKYEKLIVDALLHEIKVKGDVVQSLQHIQVGKRLPTDSNTGIFTKYCPCVLKASHQWSGLALLNCRDEIIKCSNQSPPAWS